MLRGWRGAKGDTGQCSDIHNSNIDVIIYRCNNLGSHGSDCYCNSCNNNSKYL